MINEETVKECWEQNAKTWTELARAGYDRYRDFFNTPHFLKFIPDVKNRQGLDIGCGDGENTRKLARIGAKMKAIDISKNFIACAMEIEANEPLGIEYLPASAQKMPFSDQTFDFAAAFMSMMDMADIDLAFSEIFRILKPFGFLQFSITHPCFTPPLRKKVTDENGCVSYILGDYFSNDARINESMFGAVPKEERANYNKFRIPYFHRTLSQWFDSIIKAGFIVEKLYEPFASEEEIKACPDVDDTRILGYFLHVRVRKPA